LSTAAADEAGRCTLVEHGRSAAQRVCRALAKALDRGSIERVCKGYERALDRSHEPLNPLGATTAGGGRSGPMALEHDIRESDGQIARDGPRASDVAQQPCLVEAAHAHGPLDDLTAAAELQAAIRCARDWRQAEVDVGCKPPVDLHLACAGRSAPLKRREVHVGKAHCALDLPGLFADEEHERAMRFERLHAPGPAGIGFRVS
jgi:hypothetical protein